MCACAFARFWRVSAVRCCSTSCSSVAPFGREFSRRLSKNTALICLPASPSKPPMSLYSSPMFSGVSPVKIAFAPCVRSCLCLLRPSLRCFDGWLWRLLIVPSRKNPYFCQKCLFSEVLRHWGGRCLPRVSKLFRYFPTLNPCQSWCTSVLFPTWTEVSFCPSSLNRRTIEKSTRARTTILQAPCPVYLADFSLGAKQGVPHWSGHLARLTGDLWTFGSARH